MFETELSLQRKFIELKEKNKKDNESLLSEFNARFGNVDIVEVVISDDNLLNIDQANVLSNYQHARVLAYLHRKAARTYSYLKKSTDYTEKSLSDTISKLIRAKIIEEISEKKYVIAAEFQFPHLQFISYEAKLQKWKKAVLQATINKKFSSYSYIVLPYDLAIRLHRQELNCFETFNIGLIGVTDEEFFYFYNPPKKSVSVSINPSFITSIAKFQLETSTFQEPGLA